MTEAATTPVETRTCVECRHEFDFEIATGDGFAARFVNALRRTCDDCSDRLDAADEQAQSLAAYKRRLSGANLPPEFNDVDLDSLSMDGNVRAFAAARKWGAGELRGLYLCGTIGVGKSTLAAAAVRRLLERRAVRWTLVPALVAKSFGDDRAKEQVAAILTGTGALVLDDLDKVKANEWVAAQLFSAIDQRVTAGAPLLVTSNKTPGELSKKFGADFGESIGSRLLGHCGRDGMHEMRGPDRRLGS